MQAALTHYSYILVVIGSTQAPSGENPPAARRPAARTAEVIRQYADARIDFVAALIVAMAERLAIMRILTLDQRHFRLFRPPHGAAFELLP